MFARFMHGLCKNLVTSVHDYSLSDEAGDCLFEGTFGGERPDGSSLSLDRDLRGGIGEGLGEHVAGMRSEKDVERASRNGRRRRGSCVVCEAGP